MPALGLLDYFRFDGDSVFRKMIIKLVYKLIIVIVEFTFKCNAFLLYQKNKMLILFQKIMQILIKYIILNLK